MEISQRKNIFAVWFSWQFYEVPVFLLAVWKNYLKFAENYFSVVFLAKTLFSPWRKYNWKYPKGLDVYGFFLSLTSNIFSRFLGFLLRVVLIAAGIIFYAAVFLAGLAVIVLWVGTPFLIVFGFYLLL